MSRLRNGYTPKQEAIRITLIEVRDLIDGSYNRHILQPRLGSAQKAGLLKELEQIYDRLNARLPEDLRLDRRTSNE